MAHWEFLLQKDGDRTWLPLDAPEIEILEGRYRIVARSSQPSTAVDVRIAHLAVDEDPPKRRLQKRSGQTNPDGLLVVIPFTTLQPGVWDFHCASGDLMSDLMGASQHHRLTLRVLTHESEADDWDFDWSPETDALVQAAIASPPSGPLPGVPTPALAAIANLPIPDPSLAEPLVDLEGFDSEVDPQRNRDLEPEVEPAIAQSEFLLNAVEAPKALEVDVEPEGLTEVAFSLRLNQAALWAERGKPLAIAGHLEPIALREGQPVPPPPQAIELCLRDPQSLQIVFQQTVTVTARSRSVPFQFQGELPADLATHLLLGEVILWSEVEGQPWVLTNQSVTVTLNVGELVGELDKIHQVLESHSEEFVSESDLAVAIATQLIHDRNSPFETALSKLIDWEPEPPAVKRFESIAGQPLPPLLHQPEVGPSRPKTLQLPVFGKARVTAPVALPVESDRDPELEPDPAIVVPSGSAESSPVPTADLPDLWETPSESALDCDLSDDSPDLIGVEGADMPTEEQLPEVPEQAPERSPLAPHQRAFRALKLEDRFIERLNTLASDDALNSTLKAVVQSQAIAPTIPLDSDTAQLSQEIVVDEDPTLPQDTRRFIPVDRRFSPPLRLAEPTPEPISQTPQVLTDEEPVPSPIIVVPNRELISGQAIEVRVKLPDTPVRMHVKLWINDRQTRTLMDGPFLLYDFLPDGHGALEASTRLSVPFGSLDLLFEAIAIETLTQRESRKAVEERPALPPDLPAPLVFEELGLGI